MDESNQESKNKNLALLISSVVAACVCVIIFFVVGNSSFGAENAAKKFYYSLITNNPNDAFLLLNVKEDDFVNKKVFGTTYGLTEENVKKYDTKAVKGIEFDTTMNSDHKSATVYAHASSSSFGSYGSVSIDVVRNGNVFGVFPNWEVDASNIIVKKISFKVPKGATLTINGKKVKKKYITASGSDDSHDDYVIPKMLVGTYQAAVSVNGFDAKPSDEKISSSGEEVFLNYSAPDKSVMDDVSKLFYDSFTEAMNDAKDGKNFSELESKINAEGDTSDIKEHYDELASRYAVDATQTGITSIEFSNVTVTANFYSGRALPTIAVGLSTDTTIHHNTKGSLTDEVSDTVDTVETNAKALYIFKDGRWILDLENSNLVPSFYVSD